MERKRHQAAQEKVAKVEKKVEKVAKVEKKVEDQIIEANRQEVETFRASLEFFDKKVKFGEEAFIVGQELCCQKISARFSELDLSFLG